MNFVADESIDRQIVHRLRKDGHKIFDITEMEPGISDDKVLPKANKESAILLTADRDFGDKEFHQAISVIAPGSIRIRKYGSD